MDSYSYASISSSSNSSSSSITPMTTYPKEVAKKNKPLPSYYSSLHGVRKLPSKPITKQPIAPMPPTPPKIYKVEAVDFKEAVQMLTAAPNFQSNVSNNNSSYSSGSGSSYSNSRRLQDVAPPPLDLSPVSLPRNGNNIAAQWRAFLHPTSSSSNNQFETINTAACDDSTSTEQAKERSSHVIPRNISDNNIFGSCSPLANFPLSPASFAWCSSILLSPGTLTSPSAVL